MGGLYRSAGGWRGEARVDGAQGAGLPELPCAARLPSSRDPARARDGAARAAVDETVHPRAAAALCVVLECEEEDEHGGAERVACGNDIMQAFGDCTGATPLKELVSALILYKKWRLACMDR